MGTKKYVGFRPQKVIIDIPLPDSIPWVQVMLQGMDLDADGNILALRDRVESVHKKYSNIAIDIITFVDPYTGITHEVSMAGVAEAIKVAANLWIAEGTVPETEGMSYNEFLKRVVKEV